MKTIQLWSVCCGFAGCLLLAAWSAPASACGAEGGDNRPPSANCAAAGAAHPAVHPAASPAGSTGFPVDLITGNKFLVQRDLWLPGGLSLTRFYNSRHQFDSPLGIGWRHAFHVSLTMRFRPHRRASAQIIQGDGRRIVFNATAVNQRDRFQAVNQGYGALVREPQLAPDRRWRWQWRDGSRFFFNERGLLTAIEKASGLLLTLEYDGNPLRLVAVRNRHGQQLRFAYGAPPRRLLTAVHAPDGQHLSYQYDAQGLLVGVARHGQTQWRFEHSDAHLGAITRVTGPTGRVVNQVRYGPQRRVIHAARASDAQAISLAYQLPASPAAVGVTSVTVDATGHTSRYSWRYDPVTQQRAWLSATGEGCAFCPATTVTREFDQLGRLVTVRQAGGGRSVRRYDGAGRLAAYQWFAPDGTRLASTSIRYQSARVDAPVSQLERPSLAPGKTHRLLLTRDSRGRITSIEETGYEPEPGSLRVDRSGWQASRWKKMVRQWRFRYVDFGAAAGLVASIDGPLPGPADTIRFRYDRAGRRIAQLGPYKQWRRWAYSAQGVLVSVSSDAGGEQHFKYDRSNRLISRTIDGRTTIVRRDAAGRRLHLEPSDRPPVSLVRDHAGDLIGLTDPAGHRLRLLPVSQTLPAVSHETPSHSPSGFRHEFKDDFGRSVAMIDSETGMQRTVFDLTDRPIARIDQRLTIELYKYDDLGRFAGMATSDGNGWSQAYERGRLVRRSSRFEQISRQYNASRQLLSSTINYADHTLGQRFARPLVLRRTYDRRGRLSGRDIGHGWQLQYRWRNTHELEAIHLVGPSAGSGLPADIMLAGDLQWQPFGDGRTGLLAARLGNGIHMTRSLDQSLRISAIHYAGPAGDASPATRLPEIRVGYDRNGRVARQSIGEDDFNYQYNRKGWLTGYQSSSASQHWSYQPDGTRQVQPSGKQPRLINTAIRAGHRPARQGRAARLVQSPSGAQVLLDSTGRPQYALTSEKQAYRYLYNPVGIRIGKLNLNDPQASRWFVYQNKRLFMETDATGLPLRVFVRLDDKPLAIIVFANGKPVIQWIHTDMVGQPVATTDHAAQMTWRGTFGPFGQPLGSSSEAALPAWLPLRLPGQYFDQETGYHDNYRRTYNPATGAYLGPDPLGRRAGGYRYAYAANSPLDTIDPLGLYEIDMHYYASFAIALAAGMSYDEARTIANANQHVDDHIDTEPIVRNEDGSLNLVDTVLLRAQVLRQWHFVLETPVRQPDGSYRYEISADTRISNPTSPRLRTLRRWVDGSDNRVTQMFRLGAYSHAYMDTAAHRYPDNRPIPATVSVVGTDNRLAVGHGGHFHYPDYTYNTCPEDFPDGELPSSDPDHSSGLQEWPNNEARTLTIQQDIYRLYREFSTGPARVSWEQLEQVLVLFNATREQADPDHSNPADFSQKLALLERMLADAGVVESGSGLAISFLPEAERSGQSAYDERQAALEWGEHYSDPEQYQADDVD